MLKGDTQRRILAALLARPARPVGVAELVDMLWNEDPPPNAVKNVRAYIAKLKRVFVRAGGSSPLLPIESGPSGYSLRVRAGELDSIDFVDNVRRATEAHRAGERITAGLLLDRALRLWQGDPFADLEESVFLRPEIERLRRCQLEAFELGLALGRGGELVPELGSLVERFPYQERPVALLMRALNGSGRQAEAQQVFRRARDRLVNDLGVDPTTELTDLHEALLRGEEPAYGAVVASAYGDPAERTPSTVEELDRLVMLDGMPQPPRAFQSRPEYLRRLEAVPRTAGTAGTAGVAEPAVCTVTGPPGVGKTQLVAEFARTRLAKGDSVLWVNADSSENLLAGLARVAEIGHARLRDQDTVQAAEHARRLIAGLRTPSLLVFDNAREPETIRRWLPRSGNTQVVITSSRRVFEWLAGDHMTLEAFERDEARAYLETATGLRIDQQAEDLIDAVGQSALALALASAVITTEQLDYAECLRRLRELPTRSSLAAHEGDPYPHGVLDAIRLSLESVQHNSVARPLAEQLAVLAATGTSRSLLIPEALDEHARADRSRALALLVDAYLASYAENGRLLVMHPLTRRVLAELCEAEHRLGTVIGSATTMLGDHLQRASGESQSQAQAYAELLPHLESLMAVTERGGSEAGAAHTELLALGAQVVGHFHNRCDFVRVAPLNTALHARQRRLLGDDDPRTLRACMRLASQYRRLAKLEQAVELLAGTLEHQRHRLGERHPDTCWTRYTLAATYLVAGDATTAIQMLRALLADVERSPEADPALRLGSSRRLGWALRSLGRLDEADEIYRGILGAYAEHYGEAHPQTLRTHSEWACVHRLAGRMDEAERVLTRVLARRESALGVDHPDNWHDRDRLADVRRGLGDPDSLAVFRETAEHWERTLGAGHPWTLIARNNVACGLHAGGDLDSARAMLLELWHAHEQILGPGLPRTLNVANNLACVRALRGEHRAAAELLRDVRDGRGRVLGDEHPDTLDAGHNLAVVQAASAGTAGAAGGGGAAVTAAGAAGAAGAGELPVWMRHGPAYGSGHGVDSTIRLDVADLR